MNIRIDVMETALQAIEDLAFISGLIPDLGRISTSVQGFEDYDEDEVTKLFKNPTGYMLHWMEMRRDILEGQLSVLDFKAKYVDSVSEQDRVDMQHMIFYPLELWLWNHSSRRIFSIGKELQVLLGATSMSSMCWDEVELPFESFVVMLDEPLVLKKTGVIAKCILITRLRSSDGIDHILIRMFSDTAVYKPLDWFTKSKMSEAARLAGDTRAKASKKIFVFDDCRKRLLQLGDLKCTSVFLFKPQQLGHHPIDAGLQGSLVEMSAELRDDPELLAEFNQVYSLVAKFCAYLQTLPPSSNHLSPWNRVTPPTAKGSKNKYITSGALLCEVTSSFKLTAEEIQLINEHQRRNRHTSELSAHWRRGNIHRLTADRFYPEGVLPEERKRTVWVRPCLVRKDLVKPGELVSGAVALMK